MKKNQYMLSRFLFLFFWVFILFVSSCGDRFAERNFEWDESDAEGIHLAMKVITDIMVSDIFSPPVASRVYAYASVAAYETVVHKFEDYQSLAGQLDELKPGPVPDPNLNYDFEVAATKAVLKVGHALTFDESLFHELKASTLDYLNEKEIPESIYQRSVEFGEKVAEHILDWSRGDYYAQTRTYPEYTPQRLPDKWIQTPPAYMDAIEPAWNRIRTLVIDSANQFIPPPPTEFSIDQNSQFFEEAYEVYAVLTSGDEMEKREIAGFWDCNPFAVRSIGHLMVGEKKISPGGHWMNIASLASRQSDANLMKSAEALALTAIALFDGFISCWDEKYRSNLLRPETYINRYIDPNWVPALQSPPFPEHTSGHSVISTAASIALTRVFGDNFEFDDTTQLEFELPVRSFTSFYHAAEEAAISRLYGGIHYMPAITYGSQQGRKIGKLISERVTTRLD